jgi:cell division protein FtsQ
MAAGLVATLTAGIQNAYSSLQGSDIFRLSDISVVGNRLLTREEVIGRTRLTMGGNLFDADLRSATDSLAAHPLVRKAMLIRRPPGSLVISVEEREPIALVAGDEGLSGLDTEGRCVPLPAVPFNLPVVTSFERLGVGAGLRESPASTGLSRFLKEVREADADVWGDISEINVTSPSEGRLLLVGDGLEVRVAFERGGDQARNLEAFLTGGGRTTTDLAYVDLRFDNQVVIGRR